MAKAKMKTRKAAAKRYKLTATGRVLHKQVGRSHLLSKKSSKRKRRLRLPSEVAPGFVRKLERLLPYGVED